MDLQVRYNSDHIRAFIYSYYIDIKGCEVHLRFRLEGLEIRVYVWFIDSSFLVSGLAVRRGSAFGVLTPYSKKAHQCCPFAGCLA